MPENTMHKKRLIGCVITKVWYGIWPCQGSLFLFHHIKKGLKQSSTCTHYINHLVTLNNTVVFVFYHVHQKIIIFLKHAFGHTSLPTKTFLLKKIANSNI